MMRKIIGNSIGHKINLAKFPRSSDFVCTACATGKLILRPSYLKIKAEPLQFLERIQGDICGPINLLSVPLRYFMVLFNGSSRMSYSTIKYQNGTFNKLIESQISPS